MIAYLGGLLSLMHGGNFPLNPNKYVKNILWMLPFLITAVFYQGFQWTDLFAVLCLLKATGHGRTYIPSVPLDITKEKEKAEYLVWWLYGRISDQAYKVICMSIIGFFAVSGAVIAFAFTDISVSLLFAIGGLFKGINAIIFDSNTEAREFADGVTAYTPIAILGGIIG